MKRTFLLSLLPVAVIVLLDQLTKLWIRSSMALGESRPIWGEDFFRLTYIENRGVAFGLDVASPLILSIISALAVILLIVFLYKLYKEPTPDTAAAVLLRLSLLLILSGAIGNLIDRILLGKVTDFLDFDFPDLIMTRWPAFNIADSAITIGVTILFLHVILFHRRKQNPFPPKGSTERS
ncbi:MAG: signal peptidase II [bacterium]